MVTDWLLVHPDMKSLLVWICCSRKRIRTMMPIIVQFRSFGQENDDIHSIKSYFMEMSNI